MGGLLPISQFGTNGLVPSQMGNYEIDGVIKITFNNPYGIPTFIFSLYDGANIGLFFLCACPNNPVGSKLAVVGYTAAKAYVSKTTVCIASNRNTNTSISLLPLTSKSQIKSIETITRSDFDAIKSELVEITPYNLL